MLDVGVIWVISLLLHELSEACMGPLSEIEREIFLFLPMKEAFYSLGR